ncbi:cbh [Symbiodinium natans]|uniref:Cbh protein n=1 Tax=Symbiodinium natans TaxID=878477 RepID=A0A812KB95_9DINO|nr:cbh [Symbiodinium natans]
MALLKVIFVALLQVASSVRTNVQLQADASSSGIGQDALAQWLYSSQGMDLSRSDADWMAQKGGAILNDCGVTLEDLKKLKGALYYSDLGFSKQMVKDKLFELAEQHIDPDILKQMFSALYYSSSGVDLLPKSVAQSRAVELTLGYAEPEQVKSLFSTLYSSSGVNLGKREALEKMLELARAGCDPIALKNAYARAYGSQADRLKTASESAVIENLNYKAKRYAKDGVAYTAQDFQQYYHEYFLSEWSVAPAEKRVAPDRKAYSASQFRMFFQSNWERYWDAAPVATQIRLAKDGRRYTIPEYQSYYKDAWQSEWAASPELICQECSA